MNPPLVKGLGEQNAVLSYCPLFMVFPFARQAGPPWSRLEYRGREVESG